MANTKNDYYILNNVNGNQVTIYVPCDNKTLVSKMRYPLSKEEIDDILTQAKGHEILWVDNNNQRADYFKSITESENYRDWFLLVGCLYMKKQEKLSCGKHLSSNDETTLKLIEKLLEEEFCYSLNLDKTQISQYINNKLYND